MTNQPNAYTKIVTKAWSDPEFKARLLADPKAALAECGVQVPASMQISVHEDSDDVVNMVLPISPAGEALSELELEQVAGGTVSAILSCYVGIC